MEEQELLTVTQTAKLLGCAESTLYSKCQAGSIEHIRLWGPTSRRNAIRFTRALIAAHLESHTLRSKTANANR